MDSEISRVLEGIPSKTKRFSHGDTLSLKGRLGRVKSGVVVYERNGIVCRVSGENDFINPFEVYREEDQWEVYRVETKSSEIVVWHVTDLPDPIPPLLLVKSWFLCRDQEIDYLTSLLPKHNMEEKILFALENLSAQTEADYPPIGPTRLAAYTAGGLSNTRKAVAKLFKSGTLPEKYLNLLNRRGNNA